MIQIFFYLHFTYDISCSMKEMNQNRLSVRKFLQYSLMAAQSCIDKEKSNVRIQTMQYPLNERTRDSLEPLASHPLRRQS